MTLEMYCKEKYGDLINEKASELAEKLANEKAEKLVNELAEKLVNELAEKLASERIHNERIQSAVRMLESGRFSQDDIVFFTGLKPAQVLEVRENIGNYR